MSEKTLVLIKPHADETIKQRLVQLYTEEFRSVRSKNGVSMTPGRAANFYKDHRGQGGYESLFLSLTKGPMVALILTGKDVVKKVYHFTEQSESDGTIGTGLVHCSLSPEDAEREIGLIFE